MSPFRIVVADDHELMRRAVRALLEGDAGQRVIGEAATGLETLSVVAALKPDVVILDFAMPELDGIQVATRLRQRGAETGIILLTATATPALEREALAAGIHKCISKSSAPRELVDAVKILRAQRAPMARPPALLTSAKEPSASVPPVLQRETGPGMIAPGTASTPSSGEVIAADGDEPTPTGMAAGRDG